MGQDLLTHVAHLEKTINDLNEALDTMRGNELGLILLFDHYPLVLNPF